MTRAVVVALLSITLGGCAEDPALVITGRLVFSDGSPAHLIVGVVDQYTPMPLIDQLSGSSHATDTDADGRFRIEIHEDELPNGLWELRADTTHGRAFTTIFPGVPEKAGVFDFGEVIAHDDFELSVSEGAMPVASWTAAPGTQVLTVRDAPYYASRPVWRVVTDNASVTLDPRTYQDYGAGLQIAAFVKPDTGDAARVESASAILPAALEPVIPVSRGVACVVATARRSWSGATSEAPCFATDGILESERPEICNGCRAVSVTIDLGRTRDISAVSLHAIALGTETERIIVEGALFENAFEELARIDAAGLTENAFVELSDQNDTRLVRVRISPEPEYPSAWIDEIGIFER